MASISQPFSTGNVSLKRDPDFRPMKTDIMFLVSTCMGFRYCMKNFHYFKIIFEGKTWQNSDHLP